MVTMTSWRGGEVRNNKASSPSYILYVLTIVAIHPGPRAAAMKLLSAPLLLLLAAALPAAMCFKLRATDGAHHAEGEAGAAAPTPPTPQAHFADAAAMQVWTAKALPKYATMMLWTPSCFDGAVTVNDVVIDEGPGTGVINAALTPAGGLGYAMGVGVEGPFFGGGVDRFSQKFTYLHEIGHSSKQHILSQYLPQVQLAVNGQRKTDTQQCVAPTVSGAATEVLADLTAACYMSAQPTFNLAAAEASLDTNRGGATSMFDQGWSGHHPTAAQRIKYVKKLWSDLAAKGGHHFANDCVPLMRAQLMNLDEQSVDFLPGGVSDPSKFCPAASPEGRKSFMARMCEWVTSKLFSKKS